MVHGWVQLRWASLWLDILSKLGQELSVAKKMSGLSSIGETENYLFKSRTLNCIPTPLSNNHENATKIVMPEMFLINRGNKYIWTKIFIIQLLVSDLLIAERGIFFIFAHLQWDISYIRSPTVGYKIYSLIYCGI